MANNINFDKKITDYQNSVNDQFAGVNLCADNTLEITTLVNCLNISGSQNPQSQYTLALKRIEQLNETDSSESSENELQTAIVSTENKPVKLSRCRSVDSLHEMDHPFNNNRLRSLAIAIDSKFKSLHKIIEQQNDKISDLTKKVEKNNEIEWKEQCKSRQTQEKISERLSDLERTSRHNTRHGNHW